MKAVDEDRGDFIVNIDNRETSVMATAAAAGNQIWRETNYEFSKDGRRDRTRNSPPLAESPVYSGNISNGSSPKRVSTSSKNAQVSFEAPSSSNLVDIVPERVEEETSEEEGEEEREEIASLQNRVRSPSFAAAAVENNGGGGEVLRCTTFQRRPSLLRSKTKSRLVDPPHQDHRSERVGKSGQLRPGMLPRASGMLGKQPGEEEEEDPLFDDDIPEEYKKEKLGVLTVLQWVSLVLIVAALVCTLSVPNWRRRTLRGLAWWKWEVLILVLICGRLVSGWGIKVAVFFIERNFLLRKRVLYFVYGVRKPVQNCIWLGLVLIAWHYLFDKSVEKDTNNKFLQLVNEILVCFLVGTLLWLVKTLMVKILASSFHVSTFFDRIQESLFNQYVIETLSGPPVIEIKSIQEDEERTMDEVKKLQNVGVIVPPELKATAFHSVKRNVIKRKFSRENSNKQNENILLGHLHKLSPKNISAWNMKRLMRIIRHGSLSTLEEHILESTTGDDSSKQIGSEVEAKVAARKIFQNVARRGSKFIYLVDMMRFMREEEALKTICLLGGSAESEKISKSALKNWVVNAFRERRALALTLNDTKTAVNKLHQMVNALVGVIIAIACLLILGIATSKFLLFLSSQIVVVAFVFGNTCKTVFEAIIFLFVMHPFDVGDRCEIDGVQMIVEEMNILTTVFLRFDNQKISYPNSTLSTKPISNYYRSPDMGDSIDFCVHIATPAEKISIMKQRITSYIESKKDHWYASPTIVLLNFDELNKMKLSVWLRHRMNHQDMGEKWARRGLVIEEMVKIFKELDIEYRLLPIEIKIRSMPPTNSTRMPSNWTSSNQ